MLLSSKSLYRFHKRTWKSEPASSLDISVSTSNIPINSNSTNHPPCNINNISSSLSHMVEPYTPSAGWGVYGDQQAWADLHLR
ncbi:unnamed protein product [Adineta steineri]|uniref:Uncharacterized protein n=1 Tax=Adineta steineri TaxID=433720 RepID=A0A814Q6A4_9BILA|nr:unnamed protein product [Adineta steineri]CAF1305792.1 unnamed protein product [Adineta steineri]